MKYMIVNFIGLPGKEKEVFCGALEAKDAEAALRKALDLEERPDWDYDEESQSMLGLRHGNGIEEAAYNDIYYAREAPTARGQK